MTDRVLLISSDTEWRAALAEEFALAGIAVLPTSIENRRLKSFLSQDFDAAVIWAERSTTPGGGYEVVETLAKRIRDFDRGYPILIFSVAPDDELAAIARRYEPSAIVYDDGLAVLRAEWESLRHSAVTETPTSATIEIKLGTGLIEFEARVGEVTKRGQQAWLTRPSIEALNKQFRYYDKNPDKLSGVWKITIDTASKILYENMLYCISGFVPALEDVKSKIRFHDIHFRFVVPTDDLEHVPFEVVAYGRGDEDYVRYAAPIARKLSLKPTEVLVDIERVKSIQGRDQCAVLFISAAVSGFLTHETKTFKGQKVHELGKLKHLDAERDGVLRAYGLNRVRPVNLAKSLDPIKDLRDALEQGPWDVIHFAGHSIQADEDGQVFLALPDPAYPGQLQGYSADDFAQRAAQAGARLVVLSSCESCSCRSLLRMAALGVPAVVGFRWPVHDDDAAKFTPMLHEALHRHKLSLARAFQHALLKLKEGAGGRMTPFSPILLIQPDSWHSYWLEDQHP